MNHHSPESPQSRTSNVEVSKELTLSQSENPPKIQANPIPSTSKPPLPADWQAQIAVPQPMPSVGSMPEEGIAAFKPLEEIPYESEPWQISGLLKKTGVTILVTPQGSCSFALSAYFASHLSGRTFIPFGAARYPGDVLFSTYTSNRSRSLRVVASKSFGEIKPILVQETQYPFDWKSPTASIEGALKSRAPGATAAVIIDAGPPPHRLNESKVQAAHAALNSLARQCDCLVLLVVEHTSKDTDPFERIPKNLRALRGTLLAVPLRSKALAPQSDAQAEFLLLRLPDAAPHAMTVRFKLQPVADSGEATRIDWEKITYGEPREAFRSAETIDLSNAERVAVQFAMDVIRQSGPTTSKDLQAAGRLRCGIAPTTMRDALSVARLLRYLDTVRSFDGRSFWIIPNVTPIPNSLYASHASTDGQLPF